LPVLIARLARKKSGIEVSVPNCLINCLIALIAYSNCLIAGVPVIRWGPPRPNQPCGASGAKGIAAR